jgi:hypothetical protein
MKRNLLSYLSVAEPIYNPDCIKLLNNRYISNLTVDDFCKIANYTKFLALLDEGNPDLEKICNYFGLDVDIIKECSK